MMIDNEFRQNVNVQQRVIQIKDMISRFLKAGIPCLISDIKNKIGKLLTFQKVQSPLIVILAAVLLGRRRRRRKAAEEAASAVTEENGAADAAPRTDELAAEGGGEKTAEAETAEKELAETAQ